MTEATKNLNEAYRQKIIQLIGQTENTHILKCTYTTVHTHIQIENESKGVSGRGSNTKLLFPLFRTI